MSKKISALVLFMLSLALLAVGVHAAPLPVSVDWVEVDDVQLGGASATLREEYNLGDTVDVKVRLTTGTLASDLEDVTLTVFISGYKYEIISDSVMLSKLRSDRGYTKTLSLELPALLEDGDYKVRVMLSDADYETKIADYNIAVERNNNDLVIDDVIFFDSNNVKPGEALYTLVRVKNLGDNDEEGVKVSVSVPGLGLKTSDYMDEIESEDSETSTELYLRVPTTATPGEYDVDVTLDYDNGYESTSKMYTMVVLEGDAPVADEGQTTLVSAAIEPQTVTVGSTAVYPITISNVGNEAKTYTITIEAANEWATFKVSPSNLVLLGAKEAKTVYLYATPKEGSSEENIFVVSVNDGEDSYRVALQANVVAGETETSSFRHTLEVGLIVLVVLLVIIGLIVAFTKLASRDDFDEDDEDDDETTQTYY